MIRKLPILILIIFGLMSCGYSPIYSNNNNANFEIYDLELEGDNEINNIIENKLDRYFKNFITCSFNNYYFFIFKK